MQGELIFNCFIAFIQLIIGVMFLDANKRNSFGLNYFDVKSLDHFFAPKVELDDELFKKTNRIIFFICLSMSIFTFINILLNILYKGILNISGIFLFVSLILIWPIRIFLVRYLSKTSTGKNH